MDALLARKLLYNANLTEHQKQLALIVCLQMKYETMKNVLTWIFTTAKTELQINNGVEIKEETMITENCGRGRKQFRGFMYRYTSSLELVLMEGMVQSAYFKLSCWKFMLHMENKN